MTDKQKEAAVTAAYLRGFETGQDAAKSRIAALEAALKPFADRAQYCDDMNDSESHCVFAGDLRAARAAMEGEDAQQP